MATKQTMVISTFRGCDFTNAGTDMDSDKSPNCVNMIRDVPGKIRKRMGYYKENNYGAQINGYHYLANEKLACVHAGTEIYNVGGNMKSAYFKDYKGGDNSGYINMFVDKDSIDADSKDDEEHKTPNAFVGVGAQGYVAGKYDKLVGGNQMTNMRGVCYGAGRFVAVGDGGRAYYSTDKGKNWVKMEGLATNRNYMAVAYDEAQNLFIAVGNTSIYCCRDGIHWYNACPNMNLSYNFNGVAGCGIKVSKDTNKCALIVGTNGYALLKKGKGGNYGDKVTQHQLAGTRLATVNYDRTETEEARFFVVGSGVVERWNITYNGDTPTLDSTNLYKQNTYRAVCKGENDLIYAVGDSGAFLKINTRNGTTEVMDYPLKERNNLYSIAYNGEHYVICCYNTNYAYYSKNLKDWTKLKIKYPYIWGMASPIKEQQEIFYNAKVYFTDFTNIDILPAVAEDTTYAGQKVLRLSYDITNYKANVRSIVSRCYIQGTVGIYNATEFYDSNKVTESVKSLYSGANDDRSISIPFSNKLYLLDGKNMLCYDGYTVNAVNDIAYIPKLTISKEPKGGGTDFEALNLVQPAFTEDFLVKTNTTATEFQMTFGELDATEVKAWVKNSNAEWVRKYEKTDFTVDRITGIITFTSAIGAAPVEGEDNVRITACRTVDGYADRINKCTVACLFGVGGAQDRVFVSGNPNKKYLNYDWYSQQNDATYFGDTNYCTVGNSSSKIVGYAIINNYLAAFKGDGERHQNVVIRQGNLTDSKPSFPLVNTLQGEAAIAPHSFQYLATEPVFLTKSGIMSITSQDITSEKYTQDRSFYLNGKLLKESSDDLKNAFSVVYNDMYILAVNNRLYILDGIQPMQTDKSLPYSTRQYAGFYCVNIPARIMWVDSDNVLCFGTEQGEIFKFYKDTSDIESYMDNGEPIEAIYETPDLGGKIFFKNKSFKFIAIRMGEAYITSFELWYQRNGLWTKIKEDKNSAICISFENITFSRFTFTTDNTPKTATSKIRVKKVDKMRLRLVNKQAREPFSIRDIGLEYTERGNHK